MMFPEMNGYKEINQTQQFGVDLVDQDVVSQSRRGIDNIVDRWLLS